MRRISGQRAALRWAVASAAAAGILVLAGCGQTRLGAAALYGNQRISAANLTAEVKNLTAGYQADKGKVQIQYAQADIPRQALSWMLRFATADEIARRLGITVTPAQAQAQANAEKARAAQSGDTLSEAAVLNGLPPDLLPQLGRWIAIQLKLQDKLDNGVAPTTNAAQQALVLKINHVQCVAAKSMHIKVNPQYGAYDYGQFAVVPAPSTLSTVPVASKSPAAQAPQLTPKC